MKISVTVHLPPEGMMSAEKTLQAIENQLDMTAAAAQVDFQVTTATWNHKVVFNVMKKKGIRHIFTEDKIYFFLNFGTSVRYATMSLNFRPKSRPGAIRSNKGRGGVLFISKARPRPGIKARKWDEAIQQKWDKEFPTQIQRAIDSAISGRG